MKVIAFCGPKGSGKDTAAKGLLALNAETFTNPPIYQQLNFADPLKMACMTIFGLTHDEVYDPILKETKLDRWPFVTPRELLQNVAKLFRTMYAPDIWVRAWTRRIPTVTSPYVLCTDLRHIEEIDALRAVGALIVYVQNDRVEAEREAGIAAGDPLWADPSEALCPVLKTLADKVIDNNRTIEQLHTQVLGLLVQQDAHTH